LKKLQKKANEEKLKKLKKKAKREKRLKIKREKVQNYFKMKN